MPRHAWRRPMSAAVHAYLRATAEPGARRAGPFLIRFDEHDDAPPFNYAVPDDGLSPTADEVAALVAAFRERSRVPRLEYVPQISPGVEAALLAAGFVAEGRYPLLVCPPDSVVDAPVSSRMEVRLVSDDAALWEVARVMNEAFGAPEASEHDVARLRRVLDGGGLVAAAVLEGETDGEAVGGEVVAGKVVGGGQLGRPHEGVAEVAGIAVLPPYRRRGIAGAVTALLTREAAGAGVGVPFLTPGDDAAARVYARVGYQRAGEVLHISLP
ncbi:GNAT family N-acetyltransferase [Nonomuraea sp. PA05]|uniref:GNAT family N-acetyltransferase n=1 Tax=Nonomuraea sp. PA05 TaxID=2604466 RepID=UPI0011D90957|nr:GNAT family N-acetyltransferase [Nonomuraea sp. PA05]TYB52991.1 GNAT family N-acetyltransferase [Nonomuraea sp. PA05]